MTNGLFSWRSIDATSLLPPDWQASLLQIADSFAVERSLIPTSVTSRESPDVESVPTATVGGITLSKEAAWLNELYRGPFRTLAETLFSTRVMCAQDQRIGINLNVQRYGGRYEAHVDSNPIEGLLYVTTHPPGTGGELAVSNIESAVGLSEIDATASHVYPIAGQLIFFDARRHPHYVKPLRIPGSLRVVVAMNFYTPECGELDRPPDLNAHLFGTP